MITRKSLIIILSIIAVTACDIIKDPFMENNTPIMENDTLRNVLIMDFTAFKCSVCPRAHRTIDNLQELYGDRIIPVSFHMGLLAVPETSGNGFINDFRTFEGNEISEYYKPNFLPTGIVNSYSVDSLSPYSDWPASVQYSINSDAQFSLSTDITYNQSQGVLNYSVEIKTLSDINSDIFFVSLLVEDGIVAWQVDQDAPNRYVEDYVHNAVFRKSLTGIWGDQLNSELISKGESISRDLSTFLDEEWIAENIFIISFVYDLETMEILQVTKSKVIKNI